MPISIAGDTLHPPVIIVTKAIADKMFPDGSALGKQIYLSEDSPASTIIGIVERTQQPWMSNESVENSTFVPGYMPYGNSSRYLVRTEPGRRDEVIKQVEQKLSESNSSRIIGKIRTMEETRKEAYAGDRAMAIILGTVIVALLAITALGIVGMASFWVAQRTRQIGTRRALGASRTRHPALFPDRELHHHHARPARRRGAGLCIQSVDDAELPVAATALVLRADRFPLPLGAGPARRARAGHARLARTARGGDAECVIGARDSGFGMRGFGTAEAQLSTLGMGPDRSAAFFRIPNPESRIP